MKKVIAGVLIGLSILGIGCNETIVLEENTKVNQELKVVDVKETPIEVFENFEDFVFLGFKDDNVLGIKYQDFDDENQDKSIYRVDMNGKVTKSDNEVEMVVKTDFGNSVGYGIEGIVEDPSDGEFYYKDTFNNISFRLDGYKELTERYRMGGYFVSLGKMINNDNYLIVILNKNDKQSKKGYWGISPDDQQIIIIDIENEKMYYKKEDDGGRRVVPGEEDSVKRYKNVVQGLYYDKNLESIMAVTYEGKISKVNFFGSNIELQPYKNLNLQGYEINTMINMRVDKLDETNLLINLIDPEKDFSDPNDIENIPYRYGVYNMVTDEINILEKGTFVTSALGKDKLVFVVYKEETYLAQIKEDNSIEFLYKFSGENYNCVNAFGMINEVGDRIFIRKKVYDGEKEDIGYDSSKMREEFSFIDVIEK